ncbi:MAG: hypothetical protein Q9169_004270 [Polycauliona sp. 2 TL-2023]
MEPLEAQTFRDSQERVRRMAMQKFMDKWKPLVLERTNGHGDIERLCKYEDLSPKSKATTTSTPWFELGVLLASLETWGSGSVKLELFRELRRISLYDRRTRPILQFPPELERFEQSVQQPLYRLWRAARLTDFRDEKKTVWKMVWRAAMFEEIRIYQEIVKLTPQNSSLDLSRQPKDASTIKAQIYMMYETFHGTPSAASQLLHGMQDRQCPPHATYIRFYPALNKYYGGKGILAMMPPDWSTTHFRNSTRVDAIMEGLELLKPEFRDFNRLETHAAFIDKVYQGDRLTEEGRRRLHDSLQLERPRPAAEHNKPSGNLQDPITRILRSLDNNTASITAPTSPGVVPSSSGGHTIPEEDPRVLQSEETSVEEETPALDQPLLRADGIAGGIDLLSPMPTLQRLSEGPRLMQFLPAPTNTPSTLRASRERIPSRL